MRATTTTILAPTASQAFDENFMGFLGVDELRSLFRKANAESGGRIEVREEKKCERERERERGESRSTA